MGTNDEDGRRRVLIGDEEGHRRGAARGRGDAGICASVRCTRRKKIWDESFFFSLDQTARTSGILRLGLGWCAGADYCLFF